MPKIILSGHIVVPEADLAAVQAELPTHTQLTLKESGCLIFQATQGPKNKCILKVYEEFIDRDSFESHQSRVKSSHWGEVTRHVERHYQISESN